MSARDWYAEWLLGEVWRAWDRPMTVYFPFEALATTYTDLTGHEPPPRPTEEEVRAWVEASTYNGFTFLRTMRNAAASDDPRERMMARAVVEGVAS